MNYKSKFNRIVKKLINAELDHAHVQRLWSEGKVFDDSERVLKIARKRYKDALDLLISCTIPQ